MMYFNFRKMKNPSNGDKSAYYAQVVNSTTVDIDYIVEQIRKKCTVTNADIRAVLYAMEEELIEELKRGNNVNLGKIGMFRPTIGSDPAETLAEAKSQGVRLINDVRVRFIASKEMRNEVTPNNMEFSYLNIKSARTKTDIDEESEG